LEGVSLDLGAWGFRRFLAFLRQPDGSKNVEERAIAG